MLPTLYRRASAASQAEVAAVPSLRMFARCHPSLSFCAAIHCSRLSSSHVREWTLARCGHHPFMDGRSARHRSLTHPCLCGTDACNFSHALRTCALYAPWRQAWLQRCHSFGLTHVEHLSDDALLQLLFSPHHPNNTIGVMSAHVQFVAGVCATQRSLLEGLRL